MTLSIEKLKSSSFVDPMPQETVFTRLPEMAEYYLARRANENLITTKPPVSGVKNSVARSFTDSPQVLLETVHTRGLGPLTNIKRGDSTPGATQPSSGCAGVSSTS